MIGRGLSGDSHRSSDSKLEHKSDDKVEHEHKSDKHGDKDREDTAHRSDEKSRGRKGLAVGMDMNMGMCANLIVSYCL